VRLLIRGANAAIGVENGVIVAAEPPFDGQIVVLDAELRPGLINAHDHLHRNHYGRLGRAPGEPRYANAYEWGDDIHRRYAAAIAAGRAVPRRDALLVGAWRNLFAGVTTVVHHDAWEAAFDEAFPVRVARLRCAHSLGIAPPPEVWGGDATPFSVHLAEGTDAAAADEVRGLDARGLLGPNLVAVHAVGADTDGIARLRRAGSAVVWCPTSNLFLLGATAPRALLAEGADVLVGSDSLLSAGGDLLDELRVARSLALVCDARLEAAVGATAARRLGIATPTLSVGAPADVVLLRRPLLEAGARDVAAVLVRGVPRVVDPALAPALGATFARGRHHTVASVERWILGDLPAQRAEAAQESAAELTGAR
jgi:cytosine/adenosine deaminase-related metal-dependent hydrolase